VTEPAGKAEKLDLLEVKIGEAVQRIAELTARCENLRGENERLDGELTALKESNSTLSREITELKALRDAAVGRSVDDKKILYRIDRMLEKFGELQI
jgi:FtsZ-binding cell division protein ZapB